ncbi:hypothetical protein M422DRAFT_257722 [Sphaerobolus stellatus SS14]|uniref:Uncharacterized protein n=1 Tax=Sphaerobolus stellatus (strain SS14) TaxID=990650 RepID=A0A0C9VDC2_SPHS4|nr:hypothetical protein M422DRAFT_257722 [Sphaerobolus stellatus SS14]
MQMTSTYPDKRANGALKNSQNRTSNTNSSPIDRITGVNHCQFGKAIDINNSESWGRTLSHQGPNCSPPTPPPPSGGSPDHSPSPVSPSNNNKRNLTTLIRGAVVDRETVTRNQEGQSREDYCSKLTTQNPFPNAVEEQMAANTSLMRAEVALELKIETERIYDMAIQLVTARGIQ